MSAPGWLRRRRRGVLPMWPGPGSLQGGRHYGPEAGAGVSGLEWESCDVQLWCESLGVLTEMAVVCPAPALLVETGN